MDKGHPSSEGVVGVVDADLNVGYQPAVDHDVPWPRIEQLWRGVVDQQVHCIWLAAQP